MVYGESEALDVRASIIPGRSLTRSKAPGRYFGTGAGPLFASHGDGPRLYDVDGNKYIDMVCALGAVSLGYGKWNRHGGVLSLPSPREIEASEVMLQSCAPWATHCRFLKTGSEATHAAYRIAKRATGRQFVLVGDWAYHGWHEWCSYRPDGKMESFHTVRFRHGLDLADATAHDRFGLNLDADEIAAVFIEPHRWEPVSADWLRSVRKFCDDHGIVLVFDEMIYGARWALGGASEYFGVLPDLACFGKAIGNGASVACVVGRDILRDGGELASGTYSGDTVALEAVIDTLGFYQRHGVVDRLWNVGKRLSDGLESAVAGIPTVLRGGMPVHQRLAFEDGADRKRAYRFSVEMAERGVLWHPDVVNVSYTHTDRVIDCVLEAACASLEAMQKDGVL